MKFYLLYILIRIKLQKVYELFSSELPQIFYYDNFALFTQINLSSYFVIISLFGENMKWLALMWLIVCARCQEEETTDSCTGQPTVNCICNQDGSPDTSPHIHQNNNLSQGKPGKAGPPGVKGQKVEIYIFNNYYP